MIRPEVSVGRDLICRPGNVALRCHSGRMTGRRVPEPPQWPEDLSDLFLQRANAGDVEAVVALYEPDAVLAFPRGRLAVGHEQIRAVRSSWPAGQLWARPDSARRS